MVLACFALTLLVLLGPAEAAERAKGHMSCVPAGAPLAYDCTIKLFSAATGAPLAGLEVTVGADMPTMPMAHNVKPVKATPGPEPGEYRVRLELEMHGEWAVRLRLSGAVRDQIFTHLVFTGTEVTPAGAAEHKPAMRH